MSNSPPVLLDRRVDAAIDQWKRKLLDLTKRNRALNFRPTKVSTVTIKDEQPSEVFRRLYLDQKSMRFGAIPSQAGSTNPAPNGTIELETDIEEPQEVVTSEVFTPYSRLELKDQHTDDILDAATKKLTNTQVRPSSVHSSLSGKTVCFILAFVPVFALTGMEGKLFHPLAFTKTFAMLGSTIIAVTLVPVLCTFLIRGRLHPEDHNPIMRGLRGIYRPVLDFALRQRAITLLIAAGFFGFAVYLATAIGSEFMPPLDEETAMWMPITDPSISLTKATELMVQQDRIIAADPAVEMVVGKIGRAETSTDPAPINMSETIVTLTPKDTWPAGTTKDSILQRLDAKLRTPGVTNIWTQPIRNRVDMLSTGIRTQVGVKVFGKDLKTIEEKSAEIERVLHDVPGAVDLYAERITGAPYVEIRINREAAARRGVSVGDIQDVIETAIGGKNLTYTVEGRERYPVRIRYARAFRENIETLRRVLVNDIHGAPVLLGDVAEVGITIGPSMITSENSLLRGTVLMNVRGRDVGGFVDEAKRVVAQRVAMPTGYYVEWSGQYENQLRAKERLQIVIPVVLVIIFVMLYLTYNSWIHVLIVTPVIFTWLRQREL